jgi:DNA-directed RNA polymerase specialized sigma24 family protein
MTPKEYLSQYRDADREINAKLEQIRRLKELATKTTQVITSDRVQSSPENKIERICAKIADMETEVDEEVDRLHDVKTKVERAISSVPDASQRAVLTRRYINGERWEEIAVKLNYHYRWVLELHGRALQAIKQNTAL